MPIDFVPLETTIKFAAASHLDDKWFKPRKFATHLNYEMLNNDNNQNRHYFDVPENDEIYKTYKILRFDVNPGDCIVFHMRTLHGAPGNTSKSNARRILSTRWLGIAILGTNSLLDK
jgi:ectoine hydroxylase-related dioxygenase (phytanoyl-CoA dioxygenase family)